MQCAICGNEIKSGARYPGPITEAMGEIAVSQVPGFRATHPLCRDCGENLAALAGKRKAEEALL